MPDRCNFTHPLFSKEQVSLNPQAKAAAEAFQLIQGEVTPFIVVVSKERNKTKKDLGVRIILCGVPCACSRWIKEFGDNRRILLCLLATVVLEPFQKFHVY